MTSDAILFVTLIATALAAAFAILWLRGRKAVAGRGTTEAWILIDGSNVMHWQDGVPDLAPLLGVVERLQDMGYVPGVVFDANAGWKLQGRYLHDAELAWLLGIEDRQVLVVPKGSPADAFLLETAREFGVRIVTNDRYRDWAGKHPEVQDPEFLIRGGVRAGEVWLSGLAPQDGAHGATGVRSESSTRRSR